MLRSTTKYWPGWLRNDVVMLVYQVSTRGRRQAPGSWLTRQVRTEARFIATAAIGVAKERNRVAPDHLTEETVRSTRCDIHEG